MLFPVAALPFAREAFRRGYSMVPMAGYTRRALFVATLLLTSSAASADPWNRHTIDNSSQGADGVRLADVNNDGRLDIATGWEEGGLVRVYLNPHSTRVHKPWPTIDVGHVGQPEDAVFADVDSDGHPDVVSCCEGKIRSVYVHWNPGNDHDNWRTEAFPQLKGMLPWMFCMPVEGNSGQVSELVVGSKGGAGSIGRLVPAADGGRRQLSEWTWKPLGPAAWIMSIRSEDINHDGTNDIVYSDRRPPTRGIHAWLRPRNPADEWRKITLGGTAREVMFLDIADINQDGLSDIVCDVRGSNAFILRKVNPAGSRWTTVEVNTPKQIGTGKGIAVGDINGDGTTDLVRSCENAEHRIGVYWQSQTSDGIHADWLFHDISGATDGIKFDRIELVDIDEDGDLDVLTCEERDNLGVIWYENPHR